MSQSEPTGISELKRFNDSFLERAQCDVKGALAAIGREDCAAKFDSLQKAGLSARHALDSLALTLSVAGRSLGSGERQAKPADYDKAVHMLAKLVDNLSQEREKGVKDDGWDRFFGAYDAKTNNVRQLEQYKALCRQVTRLMEQMGGYDKIVARHYADHVEPHLQAVVGRKIGGDLQSSDGKSAQLVDFLEQRACEARDRMMKSFESLADAKRPEFAVLVLANAFKTQGQTERFLKDLLDTASRPDSTTEPHSSVQGTGQPGLQGSGSPVPAAPADGPDGERLWLNDAFKNTNTNTLTADTGKLVELMTEMYRDIRASHQAEKERLQAGLDTMLESLSGSPSPSSGSVSSSTEEAAVQTERAESVDAGTQTDLPGVVPLPELPPLASPELVRAVDRMLSEGGPTFDEIGSHTPPLDDETASYVSMGFAPPVSGRAAGRQEETRVPLEIPLGSSGGGIPLSELLGEGMVLARATPYIPPPDYDMEENESAVSGQSSAAAQQTVSQPAEMPAAGMPRATELGDGIGGGNEREQAPPSPNGRGAQSDSFFPWPLRADTAHGSPNGSPGRRSVPTSPSGVILTQGGARANPAELRRLGSMEEARRTPTLPGMPRSASADQASMTANPFVVRERRASEMADGLSFPPRGNYQGKRWETVKPVNRIITTEAGLRDNPFKLRSENR